MKPLPLEQTDPWLAEFFMDIASGKKKFGINSIRVVNDKELFYTLCPVKNVVKVGRNSPCLCGSGKKFKKCCGKK